MRVTASFVRSGAFDAATTELRPPCRPFTVPHGLYGLLGANAAVNTPEPQASRRTLGCGYFLVRSFAEAARGAG